MLIDTHSHINHERLADSLAEIIKNLDTGRVGQVICPSYSLESSRTSLAVAKHPRVYAGLGIHPENATEWNAETENFLRIHLNETKVVAVGEIGLDYHYGTDKKGLQHDVCIRQMELAREFNLPVIFHVRDAWEDFFELVKNHRDLIVRGVVHCFEGDSEIAKTLLDLGLYISVTGLITFKHRDALREAVKLIPLDRLMVETDAPYLSPEPHRGELNRPEFVSLVADKVAELKCMTPVEIDEATTKTAYTFFNKMQKI